MMSRHPLFRRRLRVIRQMSETDCGACCLAMMIHYFGSHADVAECRERCGVGRDGVTARVLADAARSYGVSVRAVSVEAVALERLPLPAIVHWNFNHFVIVERCSSTEVIVVDPGTGRRQLTMDEFRSSFTGVALLLQPGAGFEKQRPCRRFRRSRYLWCHFKSAGVRSAVLQIVLSSLLLQAAALAGPLLIKLVVDQVIPLRAADVMPRVCAGIVTLLVAQALITYLRTILLLLIKTRLDSQLMSGFFDHLLALPFAFFGQRSSGDLLMRLGSNSLIRETLSEQTVSVMLDGSLVVVLLVALLASQPAFGIVALSIGLLQGLLMLGTARRLHTLMDRDVSATSESQSYLVEVLAGVETLKALGAEQRALRHWSGLFSKQLLASLERNQWAGAVNSALFALRGFSPLFLLWLGTREVLDGTMGVGTMLAMQSLAASLMTPVTSLLSGVQQLQLLGVHLDRLLDVMETMPEQSPAPPATPFRLAGRIELNHVNFRYQRHSTLVLRDISLNIEPGQNVALVGRSGSGKSTLARVLLGLHKPTDGHIAYDGTPVEHINLQVLRKQFGVVPQEPFLFRGSVRRNISFSDPGVSLERVIGAAKMACIHDDIVAMPMGYETMLAERGAGFSGGQRQRLALARALVRKPTVLLLDEATSHMDTVTEQLVQQNLQSLSCTRIVIAHRLSTIRNADLIVVLHDGAIVESGTHTELMSRNGYYEKLVRGQAKKALDCSAA